MLFVPCLLEPYSTQTRSMTVVSKPCTSWHGQKMAMQPMPSPYPYVPVTQQCPHCSTSSTVPILKPWSPPLPLSSSSWESTVGVKALV